MTDSMEQTDARLQAALTALSVASAHVQLVERRMRRRNAPADAAMLQNLTVAKAALGRLAPQIRGMGEAAVRFHEAAAPGDEDL